MTGLLPDITINTGSEFGVSGIVGNTDAGVEFIDAWVPDPYVDFTVVDVGRIIVPDTVVGRFRLRATDAGLTIETDRAHV